MNKSYLNEKQKLDDTSSYADQVNKRFGIFSQDDANKLFGKIRRLKGRDEIRKNAIKIIVRKRLDLPDNLLSTWVDPVSEDSASGENFYVSAETNSEVIFKYIPKAERDALPDSDFGYVKGERRLFPVRNQDDLDAAAKLIGRAKGLTDKDRENVRKKLKAIAKRKKLSIPETWKKEAEMSESIDLVTIA